MRIDKDVMITATLALVLAACTADEPGQTETTEANRAPPPLLLAYLKATETPSGIRIRLEETEFEVGKAVFRQGSATELDRLAKALQSHPAMGVVIEGHTDSVGRQADNVKLSEQRARSVAVALVERGIAENRISVKGLGDSLPIASNETEWGRSRNRRVEVLLVDEEPSVSAQLTTSP
ncbi:OmpA family protein [Thiohalomonas denitrificans]|uniref:OmpA family protein n=1 Tax=Thiohalomonas denitrificans TaxID=415747 RepID=A0A1G5Q9K4_9GAMM|nr:OmpA family protein [Thiohalomonas denitrificans]SCZ57959.1 OmpA family protein [Thiohalomonas denitrificans]